MQFRQETRALLRRKIGQLTRRDKFTFGTVLASPAPSTTTFTLEQLKRYPTDHWTGSIGYVVSGTGIGQSMYIQSNALGTGVATVTPALGVVLDATSVVELWPDDIRPDDVNNALNIALDGIENAINVYVETANPALDSTRKIVTIPTNFVKLVNVIYTDSGGKLIVYRYSHTPDLPRSEQGYDFYVRGRTVRLSHEIPSSIAGASILITGYRFPAQMSADADLCEAPAAYMVYAAATVLEQALAGNADVDSEGHAGRAAPWAAEAKMRAPGRNFTNFMPNTINLETTA